MFYVVYVLFPVLDVEQLVVCGLCFDSSTGCLLYVVYVLFPVLDVEQFVLCGLCFTSSTRC